MRACAASDASRPDRRRGPGPRPARRAGPGRCGNSGRRGVDPGGPVQHEVGVEGQVRQVGGDPAAGAATLADLVPVDVAGRCDEAGHERVDVAGRRAGGVELGHPTADADRVPWNPVGIVRRRVGLGAVRPWRGRPTSARRDVPSRSTICVRRSVAWPRRMGGPCRGDGDGRCSPASAGTWTCTRTRPSGAVREAHRSLSERAVTRSPAATREKSAPVGSSDVDRHRVGRSAVERTSSRASGTRG